MVAARWDEKTGEWAGKKKKSIGGGGFFGEGAKGSCQERKKGFFFFSSGPEARGSSKWGVLGGGKAERDLREEAQVWP